MPKILFLKALGPDERWITVHPNGRDNKGTPVLIRENKDGTASVIGGAGGSLNYLKIRGVKSKEDYKKESVERSKAKREAKKEQTKREKETGSYESKKAAREGLALQRRQHERKFIDFVSEAAGWSKEETRFDYDKYQHLSEPAVNKLAEKHHRSLLKRANELVELHRKQLVEDASARTEAELGEVPLEADDDKLSVQDLDPISSGSGLGFSPDYKRRAEESGLTEEALGQEAEIIKKEKLSQMTDGQRSAAIKRGESAKRLKEELQFIREPEGADTGKALIDAKKAVKLLKEQKKLKSAQKQAREAAKDIDKNIEPKAFVIEASSPDDAEIAKDIENDLRTVKTRAFLSELDKNGGEIGKHVGVGAYNSINSLALVAGGEALVDRSVVDVLGVAGAAQVLARRLANDLNKEEFGKLTDGVQEFHLHHYMETSQKAIDQAKELKEVSKSIELGEAHTGHDLQIAQELNAKRREAINQANKALGQALGEMEGNAALVAALKQGKQDSLQVSLGALSPESAIQQARAIGLQRGDYKIESAGANRFLTINSDGMDRLAKPVNREDIAQVRRNLDIIEGKHDEENWLPLGIADRPDLAMNIKPGVTERLAKPFEPGENLEQSLKDYIGGRVADGDTPADILSNIQSLEFIQKVGPDRASEYQSALDSVVPLKDQKGRSKKVESLSGLFESYADNFTEQEHGGKLSPLHRQSFKVDQVSVDALHRALSEHPEGVAAYKPIGELSNQDRRALREHFYKNIAKESPEAGEMRQKLEELTGSEPEKNVQDMFGEQTVNPAWEQWQQDKNELSAKINSSSLTWGRYVESMRGHAQAYESVQDLVRSNVSHKFAENYNRLNPGAPLKIGRTVIRNNLSHLDTVDTEAREARSEQERKLIDSQRERVQGRYASGGVTEKLAGARDRQEAAKQAQMGFFLDDPAGKSEDKPLGSGERHTVGHAAERQIAGMMEVVGKNFKPGQPTKLWNPSMTGKGIARQRAVKLIEANKRVVLSFGTGSGKSLIGLSGFTHLHGQGKAKRGMFLVPSIVQGQFHGEATRYLQPGKFSWHAEPGASREERIKAYKNPEHHFTVMTHQSFRDDMLHLGARHEGVAEDQMRDKVAGMSASERKDWMKGVLEKEGINYDYLMVDEGQNLLNRSGKENSSMANVVDAFSAHTPYYVSASGDPIKNDPSEAFDLLSKMDPDRYSDRSAFMRRYGVDTVAAKDGLKREMARYAYPSKIDPDVAVKKKEVKTELSSAQKSALDDLSKNLAAVRMARMQGKVNVSALKSISPASFEGVPDEQHESIAKELQKSVGIIKESATHKIIYNHPDNPLMDAVVNHAHENRGKPGVVFAHSLEAVQQLKERLEKAGHRVVALTGTDSSKDKEAKRLRFNPESGNADADILVASDAGATGMNIQRGQWLFQYDTPMTAMTHAQRNGRIFRIGQKNNVDLIDGTPNHPYVERARKRLKDKYELRDLMTSPMEGLDDSGLALFLRKRELDFKELSRI